MLLVGICASGVESETIFYFQKIASGVTGMLTTSPVLLLTMERLQKLSGKLEYIYAIAAQYIRTKVLRD